MNVDVVVTGPAKLGECPVWSPAEQVLYWCDIDGRAIHRFDPKSGDDDHRPLPVRPGSLALTMEPGRLVVAAEYQVGYFEWDGPRFEPWVDLEAPNTGNRLNDGRTDPAGRFWVGSMFERPSEGRRSGLLHRVDPDGATSIWREEVGVSNALAFSPDGTTMYWADTAQNTVWAHDYDPSTGTMGASRVFADFKDVPGKPDGACVDAEGCLWVACVFGSALARFTPRGDLDQLMQLPVDMPTMPAFGGRDLDTIFVTSIGLADSASSHSDSPLAGSVLAVQPGVTGLPEPAFGGSRA